MEDQNHIHLLCGRIRKWRRLMVQMFKSITAWEIFEESPL